ncbi:MAG TPA: cyclic nucleotide-binding domain-containing protein [Pseudolabrys sp.]|nr:cyclic nucleotide-binding domain-containing protein [Pseudolabrys sp.]
MLVRSFDCAAVQKSFAALPLATHEPGETVLAAGSRTGRLLILKKGAVAIIRDGIEIATASEPGATFGELSALLDQPHSADVRAIHTSQFHVAHATALQDPAALHYVAAILARRLDVANQALVDLKNQIRTGQPHELLNRTVKAMEVLMTASGASLVYAGYPFDPYV